MGPASLLIMGRYIRLSFHIIRADKVDIDIRGPVMFKYFKHLISTVVEKIFGRESMSKKEMNPTDLTELLNNHHDFMTDQEIPPDEFKSYSSVDEYNKDFLNIFQAFRREFILDYSQKDGHFKV
jgi:hypothetical protein